LFAFNGGGFSYNKFTFADTATNAFVFGGTTTDNNTSFSEIASIRSAPFTIRLGANLGTIGLWTVKGSAGNLVTLNSNSPGTQRSFTLSNPTTNNIDYLSVTDIGEISGNKFYAGVNSVDGGNNTNVYFTYNPNAASGMLMIFN